MDMSDRDDLSEVSVPGHPDGIAPNPHDAGAQPSDHAYAGDLTDPAAVAPFLGRRVNAIDERQNGHLAGVERDGDDIVLTFTDGRTATVLPQHVLVFENE
jgi:hypothetical protein